MSKRFLRSFIAAGMAALALLALDTAPAHAADSAVVLVYHRFGEDKHPSTNVRIEQFEAHIKELRNGGYKVLPMARIVDGVGAGRGLPDRSIGITIDDAYRSVYTEAWPRLRAAGLPFTLFVNTEPLDRRFGAYMTWDQLREMVQDGVTVGNHTVSHLHMVGKSPERIAREIARSQARLEAELGVTPTLFAYPYGEFSLAVRRHIAESGFKAAFGQHSGVMYGGSDMLYLPRFAVNESYGDLGRLRLALNALPLRVIDVTPVDRVIAAADNPPSFAFTLTGRAVRDQRALACYASGLGKAPMERLGDGRIRLPFERAFPRGRVRINCTMPGAGGRWRWFGTQFYVPRSAG